MSEEKKGIKELMEVLAGLKVVGVGGGRVFSDGKLNLEDLKHAPYFAENYQVLFNAVDNASEAIDEAKDLDLEELQKIGAALIDAVKEIKAAKDAQ